MSTVAIKNAIISVSDKLGLAPFVAGLTAAGVKIYSTGGTRKYLRDEGFEVVDIAEYTGFPEMMDGRVKTLHPRIFAGILSRHNQPADLAALAEHQIQQFQLVLVNLYPFKATVARAGVTDAEAIENIDIGGPSLIRAAAKNHAFTTVATSAEQYAEILAEITSAGGTSLALRRNLAGDAFERTARYDRAIANYFSRTTAGEKQDSPAADSFPESLHLQLSRVQVLRYGENPHQSAALYRLADDKPNANLVQARQLAGKELSYNNLLDLDAALAIAKSLPDCAAAVIKHNNPCGASSAETAAVAIRRAIDGDPQSAFGGVIGFNCTVDAATAEVLVHPANFVEAIVAPHFTPEAVEILTTRPKWKANVRLMECGELGQTAPQWEHRRLSGGMLVQQADRLPDPQSEWNIVTATQPTAAQMADLQFGWAVVRHVKSNAIVVAKNCALLGVGAGQMSRVDSVEIAIKKAGDHARGAILASDAFFPFADSIQQAAAAGITAVIQPGGSRRDEEVIAACNDHQMAMIFTGRRHFKH